MRRHLLGLSSAIWFVPNLLWAANPFDPFVGAYSASAAICHRNGIEYVDGCLPDAIELEKVSTAAFRLKELHAAPYASRSEMMEERKVTAPALKVEARFSSVSKRNARWTLVSIDGAAPRDERVSIEIEKSKDGLELWIRRAVDSAGRTSTEARSYFLEPIL